MRKRSVFRDFINSLRKHWATELPALRPIKDALGPTMPKASTFYAGVAHPLEMHVFVNFQHSCKAWQVGQFTINFILSKSEGPPEFWGGPWVPDDGVSFTEGSYRISNMLSRHRDKWWHLKDDDPPIITEAWRPTSYDDYEAVLAQAAADVTNDVRHVLVKLGMNDLPLR
jgi:hypothetical protein